MYAGWLVVDWACAKAGADTFVVTHLGGKEVTARMRADADVKPGAVMPFAFNLDKAVVFDPGTGKRL